MNDRLFELRKTLGLSQDKFGEKLGVTRSSISNMETGRFGITDTICKLICTTFNVNEIWMKTGQGDMFNTNEDDELAYLMGALFAEDNVFKKKFIKTMLKLDDAQWEKVKEFAIKLAKDED